MKRKAVLITLVAIIGVIASCTCIAKKETAAFIHPDNVFIDIKVTDGDGKYVEYADENSNDEYTGPKYIGTMKVYEDGIFEGRYEDDFWVLRVPDNEKFIIEDKKGRIKDWLFFELENKYNSFLSVDAEVIEKVEINKRTANLVGEPGSSMDYFVSAIIPKSNAYCTVKGVTIGQLKYDYSKEGAVVEGAKGIIEISVFDKKNDYEYIQDRYYSYGKKIHINKTKKSFKVKKALRIPDKTTRLVTNMYLTPVNRGKNMLLTWNQVKKAKSYVVYRYSPVKNEYIKVAVRNGRGSNYYNIPKADSKIGYKYKVIAKNKANGKGKNVCKISYPVWAVAAGNTKGNVKEIITSKVSLKGRVGKKTLLKASVKTGTGKRVLSRNIRWYSSNRRVARVDKKNGKVFFKKKGRCYIWAKAHNGKNSKKIKVTVK